jgi:hypothetical protein
MAEGGFTLMIKAVSSSETSVSIQETILRYIPEEDSLRRENLKPFW